MQCENAPLKHISNEKTRTDYASAKLIRTFTVRFTRIIWFGRLYYWVLNFLSDRDTASTRRWNNVILMYVLDVESKLIWPSVYAVCLLSILCVRRSGFWRPQNFQKKKKKKKKKGNRKVQEVPQSQPQTFQDSKRNKNPTKPSKHKSNKRTKSTKISSLFPKRRNRNAKRTEKHKNKMTQGKT